MGETQNSQFYDFGLFEPVTKLQNQFFLSLETPEHINEIKKIPKDLSKTCFLHILKILETENVDNFRKDGRRKMMKIRLIKSWESWIWDQYR